MTIISRNKEWDMENKWKCSLLTTLYWITHFTGLVAIQRLFVRWNEKIIIIDEKRSLKYVLFY